MGVVYQPAVPGKDLPTSTPEDQDTGLKRSLRSRHMTMISLGGVIGAGLFVGSGAVMNQTGPAAVVSYLLAGILVVLIMRMLGEMAVANPAVGSFVEYCRTALGPRAPASRSAGCTGGSGRSCWRSRPSRARRSCSAGCPASRCGR
jgi:amino acid transporter